MKKIYYFAYGSNMNLERMQKRVGGEFRNPRGAVLKGYRLVFNKKASKKKGVGYANILHEKNKEVEGVLYEITEAGLKELDGYEGYSNHYIRKKLPVKIKGSSETVYAWVYIAVEDKTESGLKPDKEYLSHLLKGESFLSEDYMEFLKQVKTID